MNVLKKKQQKKQDVQNLIEARLAPAKGNKSLHIAARVDNELDAYEEFVRLRKGLHPFLSKGYGDYIKEQNEEIKGFGLANFLSNSVFKELIVAEIRHIEDPSLELVQRCSKIIKQIVLSLAGERFEGFVFSSFVF